MCAQLLSCVWFFCDPMACSSQAYLSMGFSRQEYWSGLPFPPLGDLPDPGIEPVFPKSPALSGRFFTAKPPGKPHVCVYMCVYICVFKVSISSQCTRLASSTPAVFPTNTPWFCVTGRLFRHSLTGGGHAQQPHEPCTGLGGKASFSTVWSTRVRVSEVLGAL